MWIKFKNEDFEEIKVNLEQVTSIHFTTFIVYLVLSNKEEMKIRNSFNDNFDELVEMLINL